MSRKYHNRRHNLVDAHKNTHLVALGFLSARHPELFPHQNGGPRISLDSNGNVELRCNAGSEEAMWVGVKSAHRWAFNFLGGQSVIERKRTAQAEHRVALHLEDPKEQPDTADENDKGQRQGSKRPRVTYAPDHDREVEGWYYPPEQRGELFTFAMDPTIYAPIPYSPIYASVSFPEGYVTCISVSEEGKESEASKEPDTAEKRD